MTNLSLQDRFSLISLNALNSTRNSTAKKAAIRCISAAGVLDRFLQETEELTEDSDEYRSRLDALSVSLKEAAHLSSSAAKELEHTVYTRLNNLGLMTEASSLVSCDLEFSSAGNKILEYRTDSDEYSRQTESLRAELMEEGNVFDETVSARLEENGNEVHVIRAGTVPLLQIDNLYYECIPTQHKYYRVPVFGVQLRRYIM